MYIIIIFATIILDQYSKYLAVKYIKPVKFKKYGYFEFRYVENRGAAMGLLKNHPKLLRGFTSFLIVLLSIYEVNAYHSNANENVLLAIAFIIGGGMGNLIDRFSKGYVVDFYSLTIKKLPYFNIADFFVILGSILLILSEL